MDILLKHWLPIVLLLLPSIAAATVFAVFGKRKKELASGGRVLTAALTVLSVLSGAGLVVFVLSVGGGIELILPLLLLPLLVTLL